MPPGEPAAGIPGRLVYHSTLGSRVIIKKRIPGENGGGGGWSMREVEVVYFML